MLAPISEDARLSLIDALRGAALFGVLLVNMLWFAGFENALSGEQADALTSSRIDSVVETGIDLFVYGKSIGIFTFLFGVGFWLQMRALESRDPARAGRIYTRRTLGLLVLGVAHWLSWSGDILHVYAIGGFILLALRSWRTRTMVVFGLCFAVLARPLVAHLLLYFGTGSAVGAGAGDAQLAQRFAVFMHGGLWSAISMQFQQDVMPGFLSGALIAAVMHALGRFMIGVVVGRGGFFKDVRSHSKAFALVAVAGAAVGLVAQRDWVLRDALASHGFVKGNEWLIVIGHLSNSIGVTALTAAYVAAFGLAWQLKPLRRLLSLLAPLGRMALTNYLTYTPVCYLLFCGFGLGLMGKAGPAVCLGLSVLLFATQIVLSHLWLRHFRFGPAEWLWRWWTYGTRPLLQRC